MTTRCQHFIYMMMPLNVTPRMLRYVSFERVFRAG
ncbi:hypothetical protein OROHE_016924 [Orobanche hederae]